MSKPKNFANYVDDDFFNFDPPTTKPKRKYQDFIAGGYDPRHQNPDGTVGATWISYDDSNVVGYWQKGRVQEGTEMSVV
jgi:hypothetical protein